MALDPQLVGTFAMQFMEALEQKFGPNAELQTLALVAAVDIGDGTSEVQFRSGSAPSFDSGSSRYEVRGLLSEVLAGIDR